MIFQQGGSSFDITLICISTIGVVLFISYILFAYRVTRKGDFYHIRRWKAALWVAGISGLILLALLFVFSLAAVISNLSGKNTFGTVGLVVGVILSAFTLIVPLLFLVTIGVHHQLKWWLSSDDFLDKIWKDPGKEHRSPIQEL